MERVPTPEQQDAFKQFLARHENEPLTPELLINEIRPDISNPLQTWFNFADVDASAWEHWIDRAKQLYRFKIVHHVTPDFTLRLPITLVDSRPGRQHRGEYVPTEIIINDAEASHYTLLAELHGIRKQAFRAQQISAATAWDKITEWLTSILEEIDRTILDMSEGYKPPAAPQTQKGRRRGK